MRDAGARKLEAERRDGILGNRHRGRGRRRDDQPAEPAGAEIGLLALGDELLEAGARAIAVENVVGGLDRRLIDAAAGKQIAVAGARC